MVDKERNKKYALWKVHSMPLDGHSLGGLAGACRGSILRMEPADEKELGHLRPQCSFLVARSIKNDGEVSKGKLKGSYYNAYIVQ